MNGESIQSTKQKQIVFSSTGVHDDINTFSKDEIYGNVIHLLYLQPYRWWPWSIWKGQRLRGGDDMYPRPKDGWTVVKLQRQLPVAAFRHWTTTVDGSLGEDRHHVRFASSETRQTCHPVWIIDVETKRSWLKTGLVWWEKGRRCTHVL